MQTRFSSLFFFKQSFFVLLIAVVLDPILFMSILPRFMQLHFEIIAWAILLFSSIIFYSGVYGAGIGMALKSETGFNIYSVYKAASRFWWIYALFFIVPYVTHFIFYTFSVDIDIRILRAFMEAVLLVLVIAVIFKNEGRDVSTAGRFLRKVFFEKIHLVVLFAVIMWAIEVLYLKAARNWVGDAGFIFIGRSAHFGLMSVCFNIIAGLRQEYENCTGNKQDEIYFVEPSGGGIFQSIAMNFIRPRSGAYVILKALTPSKYRMIEFINTLWMDEMFCGGKLVAITCFTSNCAEAYWIAKRFRMAGSKVVMGGPHVMFMTEEALKFCDAVVIGNAESVWENIVHDYEANELKSVYYGEAISVNDLHNKILSLPKDDIKRVSMMAGRGCKYKCDFCAVSAMNSGKVYYKTVDEAVELVQAISKPGSSVTFRDNNIYMNPAFAREFFKRIIPLKIRWATSCSIDIAKNDEDLHLAKKSGCELLLIGYEIVSGSPEKQKGGKFSYADEYIALTKKIKAAGIHRKAQFMCGFDGENWLSLFHIWLFCLRVFPFMGAVSVVTPFPGTKIFEKLFNDERVINLNWEKYTGFFLVYSHPGYHHVLMNIIFPFFISFFVLTASGMGLFLTLLMLVFHFS